MPQASDAPAAPGPNDDTEGTNEANRCAFTPETCMDDLCRHADRGLCGKWRSDLDDEDEVDDGWTGEGL